MSEKTRQNEKIAEEVGQPIRAERGWTLGGETSGSERKGVMQWTGSEFESCFKMAVVSKLSRIYSAKDPTDDQSILDEGEIFSGSFDLAVFEKELESRVKLTEEELLRDGFGEVPWFSCLIAEELQHDEGNNCLPKKKAVGMALYYNIYSTWDGRSLFLEDIYVDPAFRVRGIGTEMLRRVAEIAVEKSCVRVDWNVLHWNKIARDFYEKLGAVCMDEWHLYRLTGQNLLEFAGKKPL